LLLRNETYKIIFKKTKPKSKAKILKVQKHRYNNVAMGIIGFKVLVFIVINPKLPIKEDRNTTKHCGGSPFQRSHIILK